MVQADRSDDGHFWRNHVGGVQPAAETDLDHLEVSAGLPEVQERHGRHYLEEADWAELAVLAGRLDRRPNLLHELCERLAGDRLETHTYTLDDAVKVRRSVEAGPVALGRQDRRDHRRRAPLALGAGDVHRRNLQVRVAQGLHEQTHSLEVEGRVAGAACRALEVGEAHHPAQCVAVV